TSERNFTTRLPSDGNTTMEKSSFPAPNSHDEPASTSKHFTSDVIDPRQIADSLTAALSGGDFDQLGQTRQAFTKESRRELDLNFPDLAALLERRSAQRSAVAPAVSDDLLREQE